MALWGVEVKSGEPYVVEPSFHGRRRLRITQATLGDYDVLGWSTVDARRASDTGGGGGADERRLSAVRLCALNPVHNPVSRLDLQIGEEESIVISVTGNSSVHLAGYYYIPAASCSNPTAAAARRRLTEHHHQQIPDNAREKNKKQRIQQDEVLASDEETFPDIHHHGNNTQRRGRDKNKKQRIEEDDVHAAVDENGCPDDDIDHDTDSESRDEDDDAHGDDVEDGSEKSDDEISSPDSSDSEEGRGTSFKENNQATDTRVKIETTLIPEAHHHDEVITDELIVGPSTGDQITSRNTTVKVKYAGRLVGSPQIVDPTDGNDIYTFKISASEVIRGWEHIVGMRVGGKRRLTIPPSLGYGEKGKGGVIPPNAWLVYEIDLLEVLPRKKAS